MGDAECVLDGVYYLLELTWDKIAAVHGGGLPYVSAQTMISRRLLQSIPYTRMTATQSSTGHGGVASRALTSSPNVVWPGTCTHTDSENRPWWKVSLGSNYVIREVKLTNRQNCCPERLQNVDIFVGDALCATDVSIPKDVSEIVVCEDPEGIVGSEVKIQKRDSDHLTLCGFEAFGYESDRRLASEPKLDFDVSSEKKHVPTHVNFGDGAGSCTVLGYNE